MGAEVQECMGQRTLDSGLPWNLKHETWNLEHGTWNMELGTWNLELE